MITFSPEYHDHPGIVITIVWNWLITFLPDSAGAVPLAKLISAGTRIDSQANRPRRNRVGIEENDLV